MKTYIIKAATGALILLTSAGPVLAQAQPVPLPPAQAEAGQFAPTFSAQEIDQLTAPIALYPDALLVQIMTAATYPLEVVAAARWVADPANANLRGDQLEAALAAEDWDPSVKSLVPFPDVLQMMNSKLDWMEQLGDAFLAQEGDVMDSIQHLRHEAQVAGTLVSTPQQTVESQGSNIVIVPANPQVVYVPYYDPFYAYGAWPYPAYPPYYFPAPYGYGYGYDYGPTLFFGASFGVVDFLWGWQRWDWGARRIYVYPNRYNAINIHRPRITSTVWQHNPYHRRGVSYRDQASRMRFEGGARGQHGQVGRGGHDGGHRAIVQPNNRGPNNRGPETRGQTNWRGQATSRGPEAVRGQPRAGRQGGQDRPNRQGGQERPDRKARPEGQARPDGQVRQARPDGQVRQARPDGQAWQARSDGQAWQGRADRQARQERVVRPNQPERFSQAGGRDARVVNAPTPRVTAPQNVAPRAEPRMAAPRVMAPRPSQAITSGSGRGVGGAHFNGGRGGEGRGGGGRGGGGGHGGERSR